ncbi:MAG: fatty acid kinase [Actinomycetota bacterium]|jgi:DAK2 domain fusion protein YloV
MTPLERFDAARLKAAILGFRDALRAHQEAINRLNVYPVPDGDTGTNMTLTMEAVAAELNGAEAMAEVCKAISHGSLMGARGNSGVILSQILRGIADVVKEQRDAGPVELAEALTAASDAAYEAVMRPVEGTILTVVRATADGAKAAAGDGSQLVACLEAARAAGADALERTPEMLPVLKQAGVVDAGGSGFLLFLDACLTVADGRALPEPPAQLAEPDLQGMDTAVGDAHHDSVSDLRYEVMYFLEAPDETIPAFKEVWAGIGDSIVVVGGDGIWNCHIHTDDIGAAVEAAIDCGRPRNIRVTDLMEQVEEERWVRDAALSPEEEAAGEPVPTAVVAIATGEGIRRIFRSLGVQQIVAGGQSMNPSTAQILEAVQAAPADEVVVLPNNKNIIPVAEQVNELTDKTVRVVKTTGIAEGFAALIEYDPQATADDNARSMADASGRILSGEVTRAVRASTCDVGPIAEGDFLGLTRDGIRVVSAELSETCTGLLAELLGDEHEIVTVIEGDGANAGTTRRITEWLHDNRPDVAHEVHHGGQPLYPYLFSVE